MKKSAPSGFTLVELLVVIAIIAILALVVVLAINPLEVLKRGRDATRLADLATMQQAISVAVQEDSANTDPWCNGADPCTGNSNSGTRKTDGTGWVKVNIAAQKTVQMSTLPVDPTNDAVTYHYLYAGDANGYELNGKLESTQYATTEDRDGKDGGNDADWYEVGNDPGLDLIDNP